MATRHSDEQYGKTVGLDVSPVTYPASARFTRREARLGISEENDESALCFPLGGQPRLTQPLAASRRWDRGENGKGESVRKHGLRYGAFNR